MADYEMESSPACPHCGYEIRDAWEVFSDLEEEVEHDCGSCEKPFSIRRTAIFYYSAEAHQDD